MYGYPILDSQQFEYNMGNVAMAIEFLYIPFVLRSRSIRHHHRRRHLTTIIVVVAVTICGMNAILWNITVSSDSFFIIGKRLFSFIVQASIDCKKSTQVKL